MARKSTTKSATTAITATTEKVVAVEKVEAEIKETKEVLKPLSDSDEIEVVNLIPNVSYLDNKTNDTYEWEEVGHVEYMTVETIKNMWRNHKTYFRNMWLKPNDERVINQLGLKNIYEKYEYVMDESNYTRKDIDKVIEIISSTTTTNGMKFSACTFIKNAVEKGDISDITVIRRLEKHLNLDLISFL